MINGAVGYGYSGAFNLMRLTVRRNIVNKYRITYT